MSAEDRAFRAIVTAFLDEHWGGRADRGADGEGGGGRARARDFERGLAEHGWLTMAWPRAYGGLEATHVEPMSFADESARSGAPTGGQGAWSAPC
ncbi:MAG: hypothetical protein FJZ92_09145 [Chloroflexi bacterium]|nr:hypothetical protein [Chloroflexota bacterium]